MEKTKSIEVEPAFSKRRVKCRIEETSRENDDGYEVESVESVCSRYHHETFSYGIGEERVRRRLALLRDKCSLKQCNFLCPHDNSLDI
jgi:hypothetical protein